MVLIPTEIKIYHGSITGETPIETTSEYKEYELMSNETYTLVADEPAEGMAFYEWTINGQTPPTIGDTTSSTTTLAPMYESEDGGDVIATYHHANKAYLDLDGLDVLATKVQKKIAYGTEDLTPGVSELAEGSFYFQYE